MTEKELKNVWLRVKNIIEERRRNPDMVFDYEKTEEELKKLQGYSISENGEVSKNFKVTADKENYQYGYDWKFFEWVEIPYEYAIVELLNGKWIRSVDKKGKVLNEYYNINELSQMTMQEIEEGVWEVAFN